MIVVGERREIEVRRIGDPKKIARKSKILRKKVKEWNLKLGIIYMPTQ